MTYLTKILSAKVYDVAAESPLDYAPKLSERIGVHVWLKREDLQPVFSFKLRGAYNMMANLTKEQLGKGTVGMEIVRQMPTELHAIFVPVGGGGLIAGIAAYVKRVLPEIKIIGVEPYDANAMALSLHYGQRIMLNQVGGFADGVSVKVVGAENFRLCRELIDGVVLVSRDAICASIKEMFEETRSILEPAGALAIAGAEAYCTYNGLKGENVVAIASGANMSFDRLRLVSQLADVGRKQEALLVTFVPDKWGSIKRFCELVAPLNITEFRYRYDVCREEAIILYSVGIRSVLELGEMLKRMESAELQTLDLSNNELKDHSQFLVGVRSNVDNEILYRFNFPERPGALEKFLDSFNPRWKITLVHYRAQGESVANVLIGFQAANHEMEEFKALIERLGCQYAFEANDEALQLLLQ